MNASDMSMVNTGLQFNTKSANKMLKDLNVTNDRANARKSLELMDQLDKL
jgi:hypothetical protein